MTPATRRNEPREARRSGPEAERSEDPIDAASRLLAYGRGTLQSPAHRGASNLQRHRAMCGALNRSAQRTPVASHLT
jgi:hypothetical protein